MFSRTCWASAETPCRRPWCRQQSVWNVDRGAWLHCRQPACCCQPTAHPTTARRRLDHVGQTPARTAARPGLENASDQSRSGHTWLLNISTITRYTTERHSARHTMYTQSDSYVISMRVGFRRHLVGKTLINVFHCDSTEICFVGKIVIIQTFS